MIIKAPDPLVLHWNLFYNFPHLVHVCLVHTLYPTSHPTALTTAKLIANFTIASNRPPSILSDPIIPFPEPPPKHQRLGNFDLDLRELILLWPPAGATETSMEDLIEVRSQEVGMETGIRTGVGRDSELGGERGLGQEEKSSARKGERVREGEPRREGREQEHESDGEREREVNW